MTKKLIVALAQLNPLVGDVNGNVEKLISVRSQLDKNVDILVTPELYISGYPIDDLVLREDFLDLVEAGLNKFPILSLNVVVDVKSLVALYNSLLCLIKFSYTYDVLAFQSYTVEVFVILSNLNVTSKSLTRSLPRFA